MRLGKRHWQKQALLGLISITATVLLTLWAYAPALDGGFVFDDNDNIVNSPALHWEEVSWENFEEAIGVSLLGGRPVANLSFALNHVAGGLSPRGYHLTNVFIHLAVGGALAWLCLLYARVASPPPGTKAPTWATAAIGFAVAGVFLLHPLNTQAVSYVVQRMASMAALFSLLSFASYLTGRYKLTRCSTAWFLGAFVLWLMGFWSKENAILLLPVIVIYELCFFRTDWRQRIEATTGREWNRSWTIGAWVVGVVFTAATAASILALSNSFSLLQSFPGRDFNGLERLLTQTRVQLLYLSLLLWPSPESLNLDHDFALSRGLLDPATTALAVSLWGLALAGVMFLCVRRPRYGFPLLAYAILHSIEAGPVNLELVFEHRMYLPMAMIALAGAALLADASARTRLTALAAILVLFLPLSGWTHARNEIWGDVVALHADIAAKSPYKLRAQHNYAVVLNSAGQSEEALEVVNRAIAIDPGNGPSRSLLGAILLKLGRAAEAAEAYRAAITMDPDHLPASLGLGAALDAAGEPEAAFRHYMGTGIQHAQAGMPWQAIPLLQEAVKLRPGDADAHHALGSTYSLAGMQNKALGEFDAALEIDPGKTESWYNLALTADALGLREKALNAYQRFVQHASPTLGPQISRARTRIEALQQK